MASTPARAAPSAARVAALLGGLVALTVIGSSAVAVALPALSSDLRLDPSGAAWVLAAFSLTFSVSTAVFGRVADLVGLRLPLRVGTLIFAGGSLLGAVAWSFPSVVAGRLLQGVGAGAVPVLAVAIITARFPDEARARALGSLTAVVTIVSSSGPLIAGALTELISWRAVLALPAVALVLAEPVARLAPGDRGAGGRLDLLGALLVAASVTALALLLQAPAIGGGASVAAALGLLAAVSFLLLARHVRRRPDGFLPRRIVLNRPLMLASFAGLTLISAYISSLFVIPKLLTELHGWSPLAIGAGMLPAAVFGAAVSRTAGSLATRAPRHLLVALLAGASAVGTLAVALSIGTPAIALAAFGLVVAGFGGGQVVLVDAIPGFVEPEVRGIALGTFNLIFFTGGTIGASASGGLADVVGLAGALGVAAVLPLAAVLMSVGLRRAGEATEPGSR